MADKTAVNRMLEQAPLPQMVENLATSIARAQLELDRQSIRITEMMAQPMKVDALPTEDGAPAPRPSPLNGRSMLELGFTPSFYHFTETTIKARVAFSSTESTEWSAGAKISAGYSIFSASVNASYSNKYSFTAEGSSEIETKIVSLPAPAPLAKLLEERERIENTEQNET